MIILHTPNRKNDGGLDMGLFSGHQQQRRKQSDASKMSLFAGYSGDDFDQKYLEILDRKRKRLQAEAKRLQEARQSEEDEYQRKILEAIQLANRGKRKR